MSFRCLYSYNNQKIEIISLETDNIIEICFKNEIMFNNETFLN
jgi:hypothetical protein